MKFKLTPDTIKEFKLIAANARTRSVRTEDTAVYIEANNGNTVYVMATNDNDVVYECVINTPVYESGSCSVYGALLCNIIKRLSAPLCELVGNNTRLQFTDNETVISLPVFYFEITKPTINETVKLTAKTCALLTAFSDVSFSIAEPSLRLDSKVSAALTTMNVVVKNGHAIFEGVQNAYGAKCSFDTEYDGYCSFAIPYELIVAAIGLFKENTSEIASFHFDTSRIAIRVGGVTVSCLRIIGKFPNVASLYDTTQTDTQIICDVGLLKEVISMALAITPASECSPITLNIPAATSLGTIKFTYSCNSNELSDEIPCSVVYGTNPLTISFAPRFMEKVFKNISGEISIFFSDSTKPAIITTDTEKNGITFTNQRILAPVHK